jgi:16S rRNA (cytosine1402-N4)-methyltransferase
VEHLGVRPGGIYLDATVGDGGHALAILEASSLAGKVLGIDRDPNSLARAVQRLRPYGDRFVPVQGNYAEMAALARARGIIWADGVLMDLGFSSRQVLEPGRGFSFRSDEPLDMRYDPASPITAAHIVNSYGEEELADLIFQYGEEPRSRAIARNIVRNRPISSASGLADLVARAVGSRKGRRMHPATRTFQALRVAVNDELKHLQAGLRSAIELLAPSGRLAIISYQSLEDRLVKSFLVQESRGCVCPPEAPTCACGRQPRVGLVNRKVIRPSSQEVQSNPRSRSAKMRVAQRL